MKVNSKLMGFDAGTKVLMADGSEKLIENIQTGDLVMSFDQLDAFGVLEPKRVLDTFMRLDRNPLHVKVENSDVELTVAPGQLFISPGSDWKDAININEIIDKSGTVHSFSVSQITRGKFQMYDIIVEDNHSLIANGVRVHNMTYSQEDVANGRDQVDSGSTSNYYRRDPSESNRHYNSGKNKKKKAKRKRDYRPEPKIDGLQSGAKILSSTADLIDVLNEIITVTTPTNLTALKGSIQSSVDNIVNYLATFYGAIYASSIGDYDKQEILTLSLIMTSAAVDMRNPFEEASVTASGKLQALSQLKVIDIALTSVQAKIDYYVGNAAEDKDLFGVDVDGQKVPKSTSKKQPTRNANGKYTQQRPEGGARNSAGPAGPSGGARSTGSGNGGGGSPGQRVQDTKGKGPPTPTAKPDRGSASKTTGSVQAGNSLAARNEATRSVANAANSGSFTTSGALGHNAKTTTSHTKTSNGSGGSTTRAGTGTRGGNTTQSGGIRGGGGAR